MSSSFTQKLIRVTLSKGGTVITLDIPQATTPNGLRECLAVSAMIDQYPVSHAEVQIRNMTPNDMNAISTFGYTAFFATDLGMKLEAGNSSDGLSVVFEGQALTAWQDFQQAPDAIFHVIAQGVAAHGIAVVSTIDYDGQFNVQDAVSQIAKTMDLEFVNNGVSLQARDAHIWGDPRSQLDQLAASANGEFVYSLDNKQLTIWPKGKARSSQGARVLISKENGMIGYPANTGHGVMISTLFNPAIRFGDTVSVKSEIPQANRDDWYCQEVKHIIECNVPGGQWMTRIMSSPLASAAASTDG